MRLRDGAKLNRWERSRTEQEAKLAKRRYVRDSRREDTSFLNSRREKLTEWILECPAFLPAFDMSKSRR